MIDGLVSVIIPVYNVEAYLDRCIKSVVSQTYPNLEIILVDDGSTDQSGDMCEAWKEFDQRIKVIHKENGGLGFARNSGLDAAQGDYVIFLDSDDYLSLSAIEECLTALDGNDADTVWYGMVKVRTDGSLMKRPLPVAAVYAGSEVTASFLPNAATDDLIHHVSLEISLNCNSFLIKKEIIDNAHWRLVSEREIISEDYYSLLYLLKHVNKVVVLPRLLYYYCLNQSSLTQSYREDRFEKNKYFYTRSLQAIKELAYTDEVKRCYSCLFFNNCVAAMKQLVHSHYKFNDKLSLLKEIINDDIFQLALEDLYVKEETFQRRTLITWLKTKRYLGCYIMLRLK